MYLSHLSEFFWFLNDLYNLLITIITTFIPGWTNTGILRCAASQGTHDRIDLKAVFSVARRFFYKMHVNQNVCRTSAVFLIPRPGCSYAFFATVARSRTELLHTQLITSIQHWHAHSASKLRNIVNLPE